MSAGISGWIEFRLDTDDEWDAVANAGMLITPSHRSFSCLFGVRNISGWKPVAPERGLPKDASSTVQRDAAEDAEYAYSHSWLTWQDIAEIDWDETVVDAYVHQYELTGAGDYSFVCGYVPNNWSRHPNAPTELKEGDTWFEGNLMSRVERITRRQAVAGNFAFVFSIMERLARRYGAENVRLVVWFDN